MEFRERLIDGQLRSSLSLVDAVPNVFPDGPIAYGDGKEKGYRIGGTLGDELTDNSRRVDDYRYHDAIHMAFLAVLEWSPIFRALLRLKRKSGPQIDETEDGARARFLEEGLAAVLFRLSVRRGNFYDERTIDGETLALVKQLTKGLEIENAPEWLWRRAINHGFRALQQLGENHGGFLVADLESRQLGYHKLYTVRRE